ncbi:unnamed protein product [Closterium sp. NIES-53]
MGECDWLTLHRRMGHVALPILQQLVKNEMVAGIREKGEPDEVLGCPTCMQAKFTRYPFSSSEATAKAPLDEVVMDVVGPLKLGAAGAEYFLTIVDVYTRMTWVYVLSKKSDVAETVKTDWLPMVERQQDRLVKAIRTDRGGEFLSKEFSLWLKKNGIRHSLTMPYSPEMNGIAERANRTITETARGLLIEAGLPDYFWPDAMRSACVAKNRALTHVGADKWVPYVEWIGRKPKVDMLRVFGCMCMALVPKHLRHNKLGAKAIWAVHLGMAQKSKGWLLWDPFAKKFLKSRDCKFIENLMYKDWKAENEENIGMRFGEVKSSGLEHVELPLELSIGSTTTRQSSLVNGGEEAKDAKEEEEEVQQVSERAPTLPSRTTSAPRIRVTPQQRQGLHVPAAEEEGRALAGAALIVGDDKESDYEECAFAFFSPVEMPGEPATLKEALESSDAEDWKKAMKSELKSIEENGTWELVELPEGRKAITSKWLFKIKSDADGKIERYKSRLVAKGYHQKEKVDYKELFAPVVEPTTLRTLLAGAAIKGWVVKQMDVTTAFLNGVLEEEIFMAQPEGFDYGSGRVLWLKKALYGLKQAPRQWYLKLRGVLEEIGFNTSSTDHSLFLLGEGEQRSFMVVYVDDILIFSPSSDLCVKGPEEESVGEEERRRFHSLVGSLMYAAVNTRPDIAFATGQCWHWRCSTLPPLSVPCCFPDALDIPTPRTYREAVSGQWASQWKAAMDSEMASWISTGTYVVDSMWIFKVKRPPGLPDVFKGRLHEEVWLWRPPGFSVTFPPVTQLSMRRPVYGLRQAPRELHDMLRTTLADLGFRPSSADPSLFVRSGSTSFFVLVYVDGLCYSRQRCSSWGEFSTIPLAVGHRLTGPFLDEPFKSSGPYVELVGCLMYLITCTRPLSVLAPFVATGRHRPVHRTATVRVANYLATTSCVGLVLGGAQPVLLTDHCDSSNGDNVETKRSTQRWQQRRRWRHNKNGSRCTVPPAPVPPDAAPPVPAPPAPGSTAPAPRAPGSPAPAPPAPASPAPVPPAPKPPAPGSLALAPPALAPPTPPAPAAPVPQVRAPPGLAAPAPPVPPAPAGTPAPPRLVAPAPSTPVPPTAEPPAPAAPLLRRVH